MRPVNLRTDLAPLANLIELVFADSMDSSGRAALREMRYLSKLGMGLPVISRMNELAMGISLGYVWMSGGQLVGNVSVYPADWPRELGSTWIIANVGVHPDHQRRGIARQLMQASMDMIRGKHGRRAILQVDVKNHPARQLYRNLGFVEERAFTTWRRVSSSFVPEAAANDVLITRRRRGDWREEFELAREMRPAERGGIGWLRPLHPSTFKQGVWKTFGDWLNLRSTEHLVIRDEADEIAAALWVTSAVATRTRLTLLCKAQYRGLYDDLLINTAIRRFGRNPIVIEHPNDETLTGGVLERYRFVQQRNVVHMRWDAR